MTQRHKTAFATAGRFFGASSVFAPWWLGLAFAISISADAGQDAASGASIAPLSVRAPLPPEVLVPPSIAAAASGDFGRLTGEALRLLQAASLVLDDPAGAMRLSDEIEPRRGRRQGGGAAPVIDRNGKGEPVVGLRPTFEAPLRQPGVLDRIHLHDALFTHDETSPVSSFVDLDDEASPNEPACVFEPWPEGESPTALLRHAVTSSHAVATTTMRPASTNERLMQGTTPPLLRAEALASMTPVGADSIPLEVIAYAFLPPISSPVPRLSAPRHQTALWEPEERQEGVGIDKERRCLAEAIYFEARGEPEQGQAAVAQVVLNRVASGLYPTTICGVVYQNRHRLNACQFSFACDGRTLRVRETRSWRTAVRIAAEVTNGKVYVGDVGSSTHYHADYVQPRWARQLEKTDVIGRHVFYKQQSRQD
jgi:hypothetical protein